MTDQEKKEFAELKRQVAELLRFMEQKKRQQLSYPLDTATQTLISKV